MHCAVQVDPNVCVFEASDLLPAPMTMREEREGVAGDLLEDRIIVMARQRHCRTLSR